MTNPAETYESYMVPTLFAPWAERLVDVAVPREGEHVLDVGCGTGIVARTVAGRIGAERVVGVDANPAMLDVARSSSNLAITWTEGKAEELPFRGGMFDLVVCQFAVMFFTDRRAGLAEMHRVLHDGGRLVVAVWDAIDRHPFYATLDAVIERRLGTSSLKDIFALGDAQALRASIAEAGFSNVEVTSATMNARFPNPEGFLAGEIDVDTAAIPAMQHLDAAARAAMTSAIRGDMEALLREHTEDEHVVLPFHAHLVRAGRP